MGPVLENVPVGSRPPTTLAASPSFGGQAAFHRRAPRRPARRDLRPRLRASRTASTQPAARAGPSTARCIDPGPGPDCQRTVPLLPGGTRWGWSPRTLIGSLWPRPSVSGGLPPGDSEAAKRAFLAAASRVMRRPVVGQVALSLSDAFASRRHRQRLSGALSTAMSICSLPMRSRSLAPLWQLSSRRLATLAGAAARVAVLTRSKRGSVVCCRFNHPGDRALPLGPRGTTTGAGRSICRRFLSATPGVDRLEPLRTAGIPLWPRQGIAPSWGTQPRHLCLNRSPEHLGLISRRPQAGRSDLWQLESDALRVPQAVAAASSLSPNRPATGGQHRSVVPPIGGHTTAG